MGERRKNLGLDSRSFSAVSFLGSSGFVVLVANKILYPYNLIIFVKIFNYKGKDYTMYIIISDANSQESNFGTCENEKIKNELMNKFTPKKLQSLLLADSFQRLGFNAMRVKRVSECASWLEYLVDVNQQSDVRLHRANFCRERLCPACAWRRSLKIFGQISQIMDKLGDDYRYLLLTLTVPNCAFSDLGATIDNLISGFNRFVRRKKVNFVIKGFIRVLEITYNARTDTWHPHLHVVLAVSPSYFQGACYIPQKDWLSLWQSAMRDPSITQVDVRAMRDKATGATTGVSMASAVAETAKYTVKSSDYIFGNAPEQTDRLVSKLLESLYHRRLIVFSGCFDDVRKSLQLDDPEDGDLVNLGSDELRPEVAYMLYECNWSAGAYSMIVKPYEHDSQLDFDDEPLLDVL